jgi:precorrin-2 dehydrogenase/sirohydrochlorin ferrochelatase
MSEFYPIYLRTRGQKCLVVGGGEVASRKAAALLESEAAVEVISPRVCPELQKMADQGRVKIRNKAYSAGDLAGALLVIAATDDPAVNEAVSGEARATGQMVNVVDDPQRSSFIVPAVVKRGEVSLAIGTSGRSPALARKLRLKLEKEFDAEYARLAELVGELRTELKSQGIRASGRAWEEALDLDLLLDLLRAGRREEARENVLRRLKQSSGIIG